MNNHNKFVIEVTARLVEHGYAMPKNRMDEYILVNESMGNICFYCEPFGYLKHPKRAQINIDFFHKKGEAKVLEWFEEMFGDLMVKYNVHEINIFMRNNNF